MFSITDFKNDCNELHNCYIYFLNFLKNYMPLIYKINLEVSKENKNEIYNTIDEDDKEIYFKYLYLHYWYNILSDQQKGNYSFQKFIDKCEHYFIINGKNIKNVKNNHMEIVFSLNSDVIKMIENEIFDIWEKIYGADNIDNNYVCRLMEKFTSFFIYAADIYDCKRAVELYKNKLSMSDFLSKKDEILYSNEKEIIEEILNNRDILFNSKKIKELSYEVIHLSLKEVIYSDYKKIVTIKSANYLDSINFDNLNNVMSYLQEINTLSSDAINKINSLLTFKKGN